MRTISRLRCAGGQRSNHPRSVERKAGRDLAGLLGLALLTVTLTAAPLEGFNVVWDSPSKDHHGSMPLGNGDIAMNAWMTADGDLHYWWRNTRLPYISLCASGDFDLQQPLLRMYAEDLLPLCRYRTKRYFGHEGAFYPECIMFWGPVFSDTYGWTPFEHRWEWDVEFRLHAPQQTIVEGVYRNGRLEKLMTSPKHRAKDVVQLPARQHP